MRIHYVLRILSVDIAIWGCMYINLLGRPFARKGLVRNQLAYRTGCPESNETRILTPSQKLQHQRRERGYMSYQ